MNAGIPEKYNWQSLKARKGADLEGHYIELLRELGQEKGMLGQIFTKTQNKIQDPACGTGGFFLAAYDYRTNIHHTLKKKPLRDEHLREFVECYRPGERHRPRETWSEDNAEGRWRRYSREDIFKRDKSLGDLDNLPEPEKIAEELIENLEAGLESFRGMLSELQS